MDAVDCPQCAENAPKRLGCTDCGLVAADLAPSPFPLFETDCIRCRHLRPLGAEQCLACEVAMLRELAKRQADTIHRLVERYGESRRPEVALA